MKLKQIMTIGLSAAVILSTVPAEATVFASSAEEASLDGTSEFSEEAAEENVVEITDSEEDTDNEEADPGSEDTDLGSEDTDLGSEDTDSGSEETDSDSADTDSIEVEEEQDTSDEAFEDAEATDSDIAAFSDGAETTSSEYGNELYSEISEDEASSTQESNGAVIKWTIYDSGTLLIENAEGGNGKTPNRAPWFEFKDRITNVVMSDDITGIGDRAFMGYDKIRRPITSQHGKL